MPPGARLSAALTVFGHNAVPATVPAANICWANGIAGAPGIGVARQAFP